MLILIFIAGMLTWLILFLLKFYLPGVFKINCYYVIPLLSSSVLDKTIRETKLARRRSFAVYMVVTWGRGILVPRALRLNL